MSEKKQLWDVGVSINRLTGNPLDDTSVFDSKTAFETYAKKDLESTTAYVGQIAAYKDGSKYHVCVIDSIGPSGEYTDITELIDKISGTGDESFKKADATLKSDLEGTDSDDISDKLTLGALKKLLKDIIGNGDDITLTDRTLKALKDAIDKINGDVNTSESFAKADIDLLRKIVGDINLTSDADISDKTLSALKTAINTASSQAQVAMNDEIAAREAADKGIYKGISGKEEWDESTDIPWEYKLSALYDKIQELKEVYTLIHSVTYYAGVFDELPSLDEKDDNADIEDRDHDPIFKLKPGIVITVGDKQWITCKDASGYNWKELGTVTVHESRLQNIESEIGTKVSTSVNNGDIWDNIANIYDILGLKNGDIVKDNNTDSQQTIKKALTSSSLAIGNEGSKTIRLTKNFGKHEIGDNGYVDIKLPTDEQSMTDFILSAFIEVQKPTVSNPSITVVQDMANENFEIGSSYTPKLTITFNPGKYQYGPDTGVMFSQYSYTFNSTVNSGNITLNTGVIKTLDGITLTTLGDDVYKFTDISATYGDSKNNAYNNIGDEYEDNNGKIYISGGSIQNLSTPGINVYAPYYVKYYTEAINNTILESLNDNTNTNPYVIDNAEKRMLHISGDNKYQDLPIEGITVTTDGMQSMLIAIPIGKIDSNKKLTICNAANQLVKQNPILAERLNVKISGGGTNDYIDEDGDGTNYRIYYVNNDAPDSGVNTYTIKYE